MTFLIVIITIFVVLFSIPFLFPREVFDGVKVIEKISESSGMFMYYSFIIEKNGDKQRVRVNSEVYRDILKGSIVTLYASDGKVINYKTSLQS
jgi:hypothetical protein